MNWFDVADKNDVRAHKLYQEMIDAMVFHDTMEGWVRVPEKLGFRNYCDGVNHGDVSTWWNGFENVKVVHYWTNDDKLYLRLPQAWETDNAS